MKKLYLSFALLLFALAACAPAEPAGPRLRITNAGDLPIENLVVLFPDSEIAFGDVPAGSTTDYQAAPNGVYNYAAYRYDQDGQTITQPVIDWVGESPRPGQAFTYVIDFDPNRQGMLAVQLLEVTQDE